MTYYLAELVNLEAKVDPPRKYYTDYKWVSFDEAFELLKFRNLQNVLVNCNEFLKRKNIIL